MTEAAAALPGAASEEADEADNMLDAAAAQSAATTAAAAAAAAQAGVPAGAANGKLGFIYDEKGTEAVFGKAGADGRPDKVPAKYWDPDKKAVKGDVVFNQLLWAEGKLGKKLEVIGGPADGQEYKVVGPEGSDYEFDTADPAVKGFLEIAKKHDVSQAFVSEVVAAVGKQLDDGHKTIFTAEIAKLGPDGLARLKNVGDFLDGNLSKEQAAALKKTVISSNILVAFEDLLKKTGAPNFLPRGDDGGPSEGKTRMTKEEWNVLNFAVDENGNRKRSMDPVYNKMVEDLRDEVFGDTRRDASGRPVSSRGGRL